jgi:hypothetical protein
LKGRAVAALLEPLISEKSGEYQPEHRVLRGVERQTIEQINIGPQWEVYPSK